jgi:hypothetical protein
MKDCTYALLMNSLSTQISYPISSGPFGIWKAYDNDAKPEVTSQIPYKEKPEKPAEAEEEEPMKPMTYENLDGEIVEVNTVVDRLEEFAAAMNGGNPPSTPPPSIKREEDTSESELSDPQSMESIEFDESFSSNAKCITVAPPSSTQSMAPQLGSNPTFPMPGTPASTQESASPSPSPSSSRSQKTLSKTRKSCVHCGTVATTAWRNGPASKRNRCQNSKCNKTRDR